MLIRIASHYRNNPKHIDKLISIKGLPEEFYFEESPEGKLLKKPWEADIDANIPLEIRHLCEPMYVTFKYSPIEKGIAGVIDHRKIMGLRINFMTQPGFETWTKIEKFVDGTLPRHEQMPEPVICAKDEHSPVFETYMPKRDAANHLYFEPSAIPEIDLRPYLIIKPVEVHQEIIEPKKEEIKIPETSSFVCEICSYTTEKAQALRMHKVKKHPKKEKVGTP